MKDQTVGIEKMSFYTPGYYIEIEALASARNVDVDRYKVGLGQEKMSVIPPGEDIVTMACEAAADILTPEDIAAIDLVLFATESGVDFSKSAGIYAHALLGLAPNCRVLEVKQACYAATGSVQLSCAYVSVNPHKKCLVLTSDIAWYGFGSVGEVTQGCGAVAMLISSHSGVCTIGPGVAGVDNVSDFYRPAYSDVPIVDGKQSIKSYLGLLKQTLTEQDFGYCCFHMPFAAMGDKANKSLGNAAISLQRLEYGKALGKIVGNIYNGSLYLSLISLLMHEPEDLSGKVIGMFSYGSGAIGEFFSVCVGPNYRASLSSASITARLSNRTCLSFQQYEELWHWFEQREKAAEYQPPAAYKTQGQRYVLTSIQQGHRFYAAI